MSWQMSSSRINPGSLCEERVHKMWWWAQSHNRNVIILSHRSRTHSNTLSQLWYIWMELGLMPLKDVEKRSDLQHLWEMVTKVWNLISKTMFNLSCRSNLSSNSTAKPTLIQNKKMTAANLRSTLAEQSVTKNPINFKRGTQRNARTHTFSRNCICFAMFRLCSTWGSAASVIFFGQR